MSNKLSYKGYFAEIWYSAKDFALFGKVMDLQDAIIFEIPDPAKANAIFEAEIDDYLKMCAEIGREPCRPFNGSFWD